MESIDDYLERKRKRQEDYTSSVKKTKLLLEETRKAMKRLKETNTPQVSVSSSVKKTKLLLEETRKAMKRLKETNTPQVSVNCVLN